MATDPTTARHGGADTSGVGSPNSDSNGNAAWQRAKALLKQIRETGKVNYG